MNDLEFRQQVLDPKSASFCAAKWYNATIWLGSGQTTSCHHPLPHAVDTEAIKLNPSALHNTPRKKQERAQMQQGERRASKDGGTRTRWSGGATSAAAARCAPRRRAPRRTAAPCNEVHTA